MDSIFDEDVDEVGGEIEAYCPSSRCKADTTHTIISMYEDEVRRVQCVVCGEIHAYRKPRGEVYDEPVEPPTMVRKKLARKPTWEEAMAQVTEHDLANCRPYSIRDTYQELDIVSHPTFDVGFVTDLLPDNKVEITFKDEQRILVHNRGDLADKMPALSNAPAPREQQRKRKRKTRAVSPLVQQFRPSSADKTSSEDTNIGLGDDELDDSGSDDPIKMAVEQIRAKRQRQASDPEALKQAQVAAAEAKAELAKRAAAKKISHNGPQGNSRKKKKKSALQSKSAEMAASPTTSAEFYSEPDQANEAIGLAVAPGGEHDGSRQVAGAAADVSSDGELHRDAAASSSLLPSARNGHAARGTLPLPPAELGGLDGVADEPTMRPESAPESVPNTAAESDVATPSTETAVNDRQHQETGDTTEASPSKSEAAIGETAGSEEHREAAPVADELEIRESSVTAAAFSGGTPARSGLLAGKSGKKNKAGEVSGDKRSLDEKARTQESASRLEKNGTTETTAKKQVAQANVTPKKAMGGKTAPAKKPTVKKSTTPAAATRSTGKAAATKKPAAKKPPARKAAANASVTPKKAMGGKAAAAKKAPVKKNSATTAKATTAKKAAAKRPIARKATDVARKAASIQPAAPKAAAAKKAASRSKAVAKPKAAVAKKAAVKKPATKKAAPKSKAVAKPKDTAARKPGAAKRTPIEKSAATKKPTPRGKAVATKASAAPKAAAKRTAGKNPVANAKKPAMKGRKAAPPKAAAAKKAAAKNTKARAAAKVVSRRSPGDVPVRSKQSPAKRKSAPTKSKAVGKSRRP